MAIYLGITLFAFLFTAVAIVPYIDFLYRIHFLPAKKNASASIPVGGGILLVAIVSLLFLLLFPLVQRFGIYITSVFPFRQELNIIFFAFISFGLLGLLSDMLLIFRISPGGIVRRILLNRSLLQMALSLVSAIMLFAYLGLQIINVPFFGVIHLGVYFIPVAALIIFFFSNSVRITDGVDGLAAGTLLISLLAFWGISLAVLDTPLSVFIALWIGSLLAFLYFNVYPARILLGQAGALAFGASLAVTGLLLGKIVALFLIGGVFFAESLVYLFRFVVKEPTLHDYLLHKNWPAPKVLMRLWLVAIMLSLLGLWLALS